MHKQMHIRISQRQLRSIIKEELESTSSNITLSIQLEIDATDAVLEHGIDAVKGALVSALKGGGVTGEIEGIVHDSLLNVVVNNEDYPVAVRSVRII